MSYQPPSSDITSDDKLWALLAYVFSPLVPVIILLMADKKDRPFLRAHNAQALVAGIASVVISSVLSWTCIIPLACLGIMIYWGYQAYQGQYVTIPVVSDLVKNQGWA